MLYGENGESAVIFLHGNRSLCHPKTDMEEVTGGVRRLVLCLMGGNTAVLDQDAREEKTERMWIDSI